MEWGVEKWHSIQKTTVIIFMGILFVIDCNLFEFVEDQGKEIYVVQ